MKLFLITILFYSSGASGFVPGTKLILVKPNGERETLSIEDYALLTRATYNNYKQIKANYKVLQRKLYNRRPQKSRTRCPALVCPKSKKNRIVFYAGTNEGALTVKEVKRRDGAVQFAVFQRAVPVGGIGYSRKLPYNLSLSMVFLYRGIYVAGLGYDF